jgi:hypothetical protein
MLTTDNRVCQACERLAVCIIAAAGLLHRHAMGYKLPADVDLSMWKVQIPLLLFRAYIMSFGHHDWLAGWRAGL